MALNIRINEEYLIASDPLQIIVKRRHIVDPSKAVGWKPGGDTTLREEWRDVAYYGSVEKALGYIVDQNVRESDATTIAQLTEEVTAMRREIASVLGR